MAKCWQDWRYALLIVKLGTVIKWHRQGFRLYWRWKSKTGRPGRPSIDAEIRELIRRISQENPLWGTPRIQSELSLLGFEVAESTVAKYRIKTPKPSSQTWKTFLSNHARDVIGIDFFTVPTATFRNLYCFIILSQARAGIEGTISQAVRETKLRKARYRGLIKTRLQHYATAAAINIQRLGAWWLGRGREQTRRSPFLALAPQTA